MGKPLSMDLRSRALAAVTRFGVATATMIRWHDQRHSTGGLTEVSKAMVTLAMIHHIAHPNRKRLPAP